MALSDEDIQDKANDPKRVTGDEGTVEEKPVGEMVLADRYTKSRAATKAPFGLTVTRIKSGGSIASD